MSFSIQRNKKNLNPILKKVNIDTQNIDKFSNIQTKPVKNLDNDYTNIECCVCYNDLNILITECRHPICLDCLLKLRKIECPMCRNELLSLPKCIKVIIPGYQPPQIIRFDD